jgi:hypothetical protein
MPEPMSLCLARTVGSVGVIVFLATSLASSSSTGVGEDRPAPSAEATAVPGNIVDVARPHDVVSLAPVGPRSEGSVAPSGVIQDASAVLLASSVPKPAYMSTLQLAPFGTRLTRIVGDPGMPIAFANGATGKWNAEARHHYSTDQPWNADESLIALEQPGGNPDLLFLDGRTYKPKLPRCSSYSRRDDRWHPTKPTIRINADGPLLEWFDIVACRRVKSWTLPFAVEFLGKTGGNVSYDGRFVVLGDSKRMFVLDMVNNMIGPSVVISYGEWVVSRMSISPSGRFAYVHYQGDENRVFDVNQTTLRLTTRPMRVPSCHGTAADGAIYDLGHEDLAENPFDNNEDVLVGQEHCGLVGQVVNGQRMGHVVMVRLRDGHVTSLTDPTDEAYAYHISARNTKRPGWVYVSYYPNEPGKRFNQEIISVKMDGRKSVERWAHHHSADQGCNRCEVDPVPSPDGLRLLLNSVWNLNCGTGCGTLALRQAYVLDGWPRR